MASSVISNAVEKAKGIMSGEQSTKVAQLSSETKDVHDKSWRITSDSGVKQANTDDWLKVANEDRTGPMLLEDHFAREKARVLHPIATHTFTNECRFIALITSAFPSVSFMHEALLHSENSHFTNHSRISPVLVS
jgi:hypothetical protein